MVRKLHTDSVQCTLYTVHCTEYTVHCTVYSVLCTVYSVQSTLYTVCVQFPYHGPDPDIRALRLHSRGQLQMELCLFRFFCMVLLCSTLLTNIKTVPRGNKIMLSLGQILMQTILAAIYFDFFLADTFIFDAN